MSLEQMKEAEEWGKGNNGFVAGGNFEDDPSLKLYTVRRYQQMKQDGQLSKLSKQVELEQATNSVMQLPMDNLDIDEGTIGDS